jgi:hypothetical protein
VEIEILDVAGYDTRTPKSAHAEWEQLPWQWHREGHPLPTKGRLLIDTALSVAAGTNFGHVDQFVV